MPPPATGWRERLSDMYNSYKGGKFEDNGWPVCVLEVYTFLKPARPTPVRIDVCTSVSLLSVRSKATMRSNILPVPKAPTVSPTAAALLSVRFTLSTPPSITIIHSLSPPAHQAFLKTTLTGGFPDCVRGYLCSSFLSIFGNSTFSNSHSRCPLVYTRQNTRGDLLDDYLHNHYCTVSLPA